MAKIEWHDDGERELATGKAMKAKLDAVAFALTAHAIPHSGVDTGRLVNSMDHGTEVQDGVLVAYLGSNASSPSLDPVEYADYHWAGREAPDHNDEPNRLEIRRRVPHPTKKAPTKPYSKAMRELNVEYTVEVFES